MSEIFLAVARSPMWRNEGRHQKKPSVGILKKEEKQPSSSNCKSTNKQKKKKGPIRPLRPGPEELQAGTSAPSYVIGSNDEKVFKSVGIVSRETYSEFKDATLLESPKINENDSATYSSQFVKPDMALQETIEIEMGVVDEDEENH